MSTNHIGICPTCHGTGWDDAFNSLCGDCGTDPNTSSSLTEIRAVYAEQEALKERARSLDSEMVDWLASQIYRNEFAASLMKYYKRNGTLTDRQWAAGHKMWNRSKEEAAAALVGGWIYRWTKHDGSWCLIGPVGDPGSRVTVRKANGDEQVQLLGALVVAGSDGRCVYRVGRP
jgi:hypothetical protein